MSEKTGLIFDIRKDSYQDGPGNRTVILFKGCSLFCWWCEDPESQSPVIEVHVTKTRCIQCGTCIRICPMDAVDYEQDLENKTAIVIDRDVCIACGACLEACPGNARALTGTQMTVAEVMRQIEAGRDNYMQSGGGVTFGGGEPLIQNQFLEELLHQCRQSGISTAVSTSAYAPWEIIDRLRSEIDLFLCEIKFIDDARHTHFTGLSNELILENLKRLDHLGHPIILRVPLIPGTNDDEINLRAIARFASELHCLQGVELLFYRQIAEDRFVRLGKPYLVKENHLFSEEQVHNTIRIFEEFGLPTHVADLQV
jgi:pyruvate formate lyase activating enzyme